MTSSGLDAYAVVTAQVPEPPPEPDPQVVARENRQALFTDEHAAAWTAPLSPARPGRQHTPAPPEASGPPGDTAAAERGAMCILGTGGGHVSRGLHCPHNLPDPGGPDDVTTVSFWA